MLKKIIYVTVFTILMNCAVTFSSNMTALDYATISKEENGAFDVQKELEESFKKESKKRTAKQRNQDRISGPGAIETSGNYVVNQDSTEYFSNVVPAENQTEFLEAIDTKYGIVFKSKRHFKTNLGEFDLNTATFETVDLGDRQKYRFKLNIGKVNKKSKSYALYLKAYDIFGNFVTYNRTVIDPSHTVNKDITLDIFGNNDAHIARIDFGLDTSGMVAEAIANYNVSTAYFNCANALIKINDPANGYDDETKQKLLESYNNYYKDHLEYAKEYVKEKADIYEVE